MAEVEVMMDSAPVSEPISALPSLSPKCALTDCSSEGADNGNGNQNEDDHEQNGLMLEEKCKDEDLGALVKPTSEMKNVEEEDTPVSGNLSVNACVGDGGLSSSQKATLAEVGNRNSVGTPANAPKKSNLKRPKCETPEQNGSRTSTPKRIRIVENMDAANSNIFMQLGGNCSTSERLQGVDEAATITETKAGDEKIVWLNAGSSYINQALVNVDYVRDNLSAVKRVFSVEIDMRFILTEAVTAILSSKTKISSVGPSDFHLWVDRHSRSKAVKFSKNRFTYKEDFLKMANLDALLNYDLTAPQELISESSQSSETAGIYYVGDLWHNSKGFREYILSKTSHSQNLFSTKILAMKTKGPRSSEKTICNKVGILFSDNSPSKPVEDNVDLAHLPTEMVEAHRGFLDPQDILDVETLNSYVDFVNTRSNGKGLHTLLIDNPEISFAYESCREIRYQKYFYCECLLALRCLKEGGTFICKVFDSFTPFTTGLLFLLYKCFKSITIHKPTSSPSYTSERFLICKGKLDNGDSKYAVDFLYDCLDMVVNNQEQRKIVRRRVRKRLAILKMEVQNIVPLKVILSHAEFFQFIRRNNIRLCTDLSESIDELCDFICENHQGIGVATTIVQGKNLPLCNIAATLPEITIFKSQDSLERCKDFLARHNIIEDAFKLKRLLNKESLPSGDSDTLVVFPIQGTQPRSVFKSLHGFFFGSGGSNILYFNGNSWITLNCSEFSLPYGTIVLGEVAEEACCIGKQRQVGRYFHLFDAVFLSETFIGSYPFKTRQKILGRFVNSLRNATSSLNEHYCVIPPLTLSSVPEFCHKSSTEDIVKFGYEKGRTYLRSDCKLDNRKNLAIVGGFMIFDSCAASSANERLANSCLTWFSNPDDVDLEASWRNLISVSLNVEMSV